MWVRGHLRSLKVLSFESLVTVSYSPSIVTMAVSLAISEIFSVKQWPDLEIWVWSRSRSLKMERFDRPSTTASESSLCWVVTLKKKKKKKKTMYYFLLVCHCNYSSILYRLRVIWRWILLWPWNMGQRSLKVIETCAIRKLGCGFLFVFYSNCGRICSRLWDI